MEQARRIHAEAQRAAGANLGLPTPQVAVRANLVVTEAPFSSTPLHAHIDTSGGGFDIGASHLDDPDVTVSLDYATARGLFVAGNVQAVLQAFLAGQLKVDGDLSKLLAPSSGIWPGAWAGPPAGPTGEGGAGSAQPSLAYPAPAALDLANRLAEITE